MKVGSRNWTEVSLNCWWLIISLFINIKGFLFLCSLNYVGRMRSVLNLERRDRSLNFEEPRHRISHGRTPSVHALPFSGVLYCFVVCSLIIFFSFLPTSTYIRYDNVGKSALIVATVTVCYWATLSAFIATVQ